MAEEKPRKRKRKHLPNMSEHLDLVPLIDCVFLLLLFFMLCGRLSNEVRTEQITVPPTRTAEKFKVTGWGRVVINVYGKTQDGKPPRNTIAIPPASPWVSQGADDYTGYQKMRQAMNKVYDSAEKYEDSKQKGLMLPKVIVEIRADSETEYRVVQEVQQVLTDTIDPFNQMLPKVPVIGQMKCFVNIDFTTRKPGDKI
ncbi:MAG: biopolymer transporter ExbD [Planctomycetota bacterium]